MSNSLPLPFIVSWQTAPRNCVDAATSLYTCLSAKPTIDEFIIRFEPYGCNCLAVTELPIPFAPGLGRTRRTINSLKRRT